MNRDCWRKLRLALVLSCGASLLAAEKPPCAVRLDLNQAGVKELELLPGVGRPRAEMIVRVRERNGPFKSVEELWALPRLTKKQFAVLEECLIVAGRMTKGQAERVPSDRAAQTVETEP